MAAKARGQGKKGRPEGPRKKEALRGSHPDATPRPGLRPLWVAGLVALVAALGIWYALDWSTGEPISATEHAPTAVRERDLARAAEERGQEGNGEGEQTMTPAEGGPAIERLELEVVALYPHDDQAYTQGFLWHDGSVYESTGLKGRSSVRRWDLASGETLQETALSPDLFGEGLARVGDRLIQLTWTAGRALVYDLATLEQVGEHAYAGQGWGLCHDGAHLVMSDGSDVLLLRDPEGFEVVERVAVTLDGKPLANLNELECHGGQVYANIYQTETIARIDPATGRVTALIDASGLLEPEEARRAEVLNGIAYRPEGGTFLLTGKLWPHVFEVRLVPAE